MMVLSVLIIQSIIQRERISDEVLELLESKIAEIDVYYCTPEEIDEANVNSYGLLLLQDETVALYLKTVKNCRNVIFWHQLSDLSLQLDVFLQLKRHTDQFPLELKNWKLTEVLHNSDDSIIYKAEGSDGTLVAIKRFKFSPSSLSTEAIQTLLTGVEEQRVLSCPNGLIKLHDGGVCDQAFYIVMEYLGYGSLRQALKGCGNELPLIHALEWFQEIVLALNCVHKAGLIHRDLKIDNILMRGDGSLVLTDFGLSKRLLLDTGLVYENELHCSPHYVSPEQISGYACSQASDIYSLGVIFYELLTGHKPYCAQQAHELMMHHIMAPVPVLPRNLRQYQPLLEKMMAKNPEDRFSSVIEAIDSLPIAA